MPKRHTEHRCPACERAFKSVLDYPRARILSVTPLPTPEAVDTMSGAAAEKRLARKRKRPEEVLAFLEDGIIMTPEIQRACESAPVKDYLSCLSKFVGHEVATRELLPRFEPDGRFRWAYPVPETAIYISLAESDETPAQGRMAEVHVHCKGPNLGSAGGPTLQMLGAVVRIEYEGLLTTGSSQARGE